MFLMAYYAIRYIATVRALGSVSPALQVPLALVYYAVPVGFVLTGVQSGLTVVRNLTARDVYLSYTEKDDYHESPPHAL
jgi:TRAP-type C4-dicarboxylate transport system permease small subunit